MPKYNYDEEREETIRPLKTNTSKPRKKKSDHKHEYETVETDIEFLFYSQKGQKIVLMKHTCKICGRQGKSDWRKVDE